VKVRLTKGFTLTIGGTPVYHRPAGHIMEVPEHQADIMIRNGQAELFTETLLPHLFAKKRERV
jgi:hypothetical protein